MRWLHGRTSGVYGDAGNAAVTAVPNSMNVSVSPGIGWLNDADNNGIVWWSSEATELVIDAAHTTLDRIDRIIVEWYVGDYSNKPEIMVLKGTNASSPTPPALTNNTLYRQISLAQVSIPAGIDNGQSVRIREKGEPGVNGGPRGDLLVEVVVQRHEIFQRQDMDIFSTAPISYAQAALGGEVLIDTIDGKVAYEVKPGTQTDTRVRLKGKGVPSLRNKQVRGDQYVTLVVQVPTKLNGEAKDLLKRFDELTGNSLHSTDDYRDKKKRGFFGNKS